MAIVKRIIAARRPFPASVDHGGVRTARKRGPDAATTRRGIQLSPVIAVSGGEKSERSGPGG
jgi:hypothetical protein